MGIESIHSLFLYSLLVSRKERSKEFLIVSLSS